MPNKNELMNWRGDVLITWPFDLGLSRTRIVSQKVFAAIWISLTFKYFTSSKKIKIKKRDRDHPEKNKMHFLYDDLIY